MNSNDYAPVVILGHGDVGKKIEPEGRRRGREDWDNRKCMSSIWRNGGGREIGKVTEKECIPGFVRFTSWRVNDGCVVKNACPPGVVGGKIG